MPSPRASNKNPNSNEDIATQETPPRSGNAEEKHSSVVRFGTPGFPSPLDRLRSNQCRKRIMPGTESSSSLNTDFKEIVQEFEECNLSNSEKNRSFEYNQSFPKVRHNKSFEEVRLADCEVYRNMKKFINTDNETPERVFGSNPDRKNQVASSFRKAAEMSLNEHSFSFTSIGSKGSFQNIPN